MAGARDVQSAAIGSVEAAVEWASGVRARRAELVSDVAGGLDARGVLDRVRDDAPLAATFVVVVLEAVPAVGKVGARRALARAGIDESSPVGSIAEEDLSTLWTAPGRRAL